MARLQALLLDFGGTLAREVPGRHVIYAESARARGLAVEDTAMAAAMRCAHAALPLEIDGGFRYSDPWFRRFIEHVFVSQLGLERAQLGEVTEQLFARFTDPRTFQPYDGAAELLATARELDLRVALVSNWGGRLGQIIEGMGWSSAFDCVLASADEGLEKPDARMFERALEQLGAEPAAAIFAGDRADNDVEGARRAGLEGVLVRHALTEETPPVPPPSQTDGAERVCSLVQLTALIRERSAPSA